MSECLTDLSDLAHLPFVGRAVAGPRQRALLHGTSSVKRCKGGSTQVKGVMGIIVELMSISKVFLTCCQDLACLKEKQVTLGDASNHTNQWLSKIHNKHIVFFTGNVV